MHATKLDKLKYIIFYFYLTQAHEPLSAVYIFKINQLL